MDELIPVERMENKIYLIRGQKVMIDKDLSDFMFQLSKEEHDHLRFQNGTLKKGQHSKYLPHVFTENGIAMLSSVLRSERAIQMNIAIMRAFTRLREIISTHKELANKIEELEKKYSKHENEITAVFRLLKKLMEPTPETQHKRIGFITDRCQGLGNRDKGGG